MEETALRLYGLSECRISMVKQLLRKRCFGIAQVFFTFVYISLVIACFICHDIWYEERCSQFLMSQEIP